MQRRLGNPTTLILDWITKAVTARACGDHGQAVTYAAIAAEQADSAAGRTPARWRRTQATLKRVTLKRCRYLSRPTGTG